MHAGHLSFLLLNILVSLICLIYAVNKWSVDFGDFWNPVQGRLISPYAALAKRLRFPHESQGYQWRFGFSVTLLLFVGTILRWVSEAGGPSTPIAPQGIVSLEVAFDPKTAGAILASWKATSKIWPQAWGVLLDTLFFIPAYVGLLYGLCRWTSVRAGEAVKRLKGRAYDRNKDLAARAGDVILRGVIAAGVLDLLENIILIIMLMVFGPRDNPNPGLLAPLCAGISTLKWAGIAMTVVYWLSLLYLNPDVRRFFGALRLTAASLVVPLLVSVVLNLGQGQEALRVLAEDMTVGEFPFHSRSYLWGFVNALWSVLENVRSGSVFSTGALGRLVGAVVGGLFLCLLAGYCAFLLLRESDWLAAASRSSPDGGGAAHPAAPSHEDGSAGAAWAGGHLPDIARAGTLLLIALAVYRASKPFQENAGARHTSEWFTLLILFPFLVLASVIVLGLHWLRRYDKSRSAGARPPRVIAWALRLRNRLNLEKLTGAADGGRKKYTEKRPGERVILAFKFLITSLVVSLLLALPGRYASVFALWFGPVFWLFFGAALVIPVFSLFALESIRTRIPLVPILLAMAAAWAALGLSDNHDARTLARYDRAITTSRTVPDARRRFLEWLAARKDLEAYRNPNTGRIDYPVFFVAAQGGGIRAAYQTSQTLATLQQRNPWFAQHTFAISSVSGGSLGAAIFAAMAAQQGEALNQKPGHPYKPQGSGMHWPTVADEIAGRDLLSLPIAQLLTTNFIQVFLPAPVGQFDRSRGLEYGLDRAWGGSWRTEHGSALDGNPFEKSFYALNSGAANGAVPALFLNSTCVETGNRLVVSSLAPTDPEPEYDGRRLPQEGHLDDDGLMNERPCVNGMRILAGVSPESDLPLSTAAVLSARFPIISSSGAVVEHKYIPPSDKNGVTTGYVTVKRRHVDGGYYENSGVGTLQDLLTALNADDYGPHPAVNDNLGPLANDRNTITPTIQAQSPEEAATLGLSDAVIRRLRGVTWRPVVLTLTFADGTESSFNRDDKETYSDASRLEALPRNWRKVFPRQTRAESVEPAAPAVALLGTVLEHNDLAHRRMERLLLRREASDACNSKSDRTDPKAPCFTSKLPGGKKRLLDFRFRSETADLPLGWMLSRAARAEIQRQIGDKKNIAKEFSKAIDQSRAEVQDHNTRKTRGRDGKTEVPLAPALRWRTEMHNQNLLAAFDKILEKSRKPLPVSAQPGSGSQKIDAR